jgi:hypothetical protein
LSFEDINLIILDMEVICLCFQNGRSYDDQFQEYYSNLIHVAPENDMLKAILFNHNPLDDISDDNEYFSALNDFNFYIFF